LVKQRQAAMTLQGKYYGPMAGMAQGKIPYNGDIVARNAGYLEVLSKIALDGFVDSTKDVTVKDRRPAGDLERACQVQGSGRKSSRARSGALVAATKNR